MTNTEITAAYEAATAKFDAAYWVYEEAAQAYRNGKIGDAEYLAARATFDAVKAEFDVAFLAMSELPEEEDIAGEEAMQPSLF